MIRPALWPKDGLYLVRSKASIHRAERLEEGSIVTVRIEVLGG